MRYPWSGHRAYLGEEQLPWLTTDWVLSQFSRQKAAAKRRYAKFIQEGLGEGYRIEFHSGGEEDARVLGEDRFVTRVFKRENTRLKPPSVNKIVRVVCHHYGIKEQELSDRSRQRHLAEARGVIAWMVVQNESGTLTALAQKFNRDLSALSLAVRKIGELRKEKKEFDRKLMSFKNSVTQA
jgi:putative transposase